MTVRFSVLDEHRAALRSAAIRSRAECPDLAVEPGYVFAFGRYVDDAAHAWLASLEADDERPEVFFVPSPRLAAGVLPPPLGRFAFPATWIE
jgi:hypothetical protein